MRAPLSTYRLQFNRDFTLKDAHRLVDYLAELGITDVYASPLLKSRTGSNHGYDVIDPTEIDPEVGSLDDLRALGAALRSRGMGLLLDIVPNHMAASVENPWWWDVLKRGRASRYAAFFDIDWNRKLLLPVLGEPYGEALESGSFLVSLKDGEAALEYRGLRLPLTIPENADLSNPDGLDRVLSMQPYRLAYWRKASDAINYRRFFDISDLVALRADCEEVFNATHALVLELVESGIVTGLRIDHIDGLRDPQGYLERLPPVYVVVEKILAGREQLRTDWKVWGTTGYDFLNAVNGLFVDRAGYEDLKRAYAEWVGSAGRAVDVYWAQQRKVMDALFSGEVRSLTHALADLAEEDRHARDLSWQELQEAVVAVTACLPVYRTYTRADACVSETDRCRIEDAVSVANRVSPSPAIAFLRRVLLLDVPHYLEDRRQAWLEFVLRWQQFTGAVMAKGLEDTTFYAFNPLTSVNEVGGDAGGPEAYFGIEEFHRRMQERRSRWPFTMNAGSTHDTKRSEDVRARINVLSEFPKEWATRLKRWRRWNRAESGPDENEQILIYQTLLGAWPIEPARLKQYVRKALREAKVHTSWTDIDAAYEQRVLEFVDRILDRTRSAEFLEDFEAFQKKIAFYGALSSLAQTVLRMTAPGAPDFYQGSEIWQYHLADPDNRRPVDFERRRRMLEELKSGASCEDLLKTWEDGRIRMYVIWKTLNFRRSRPDLFLRGDYQPLRASGRASDHVVAFARRYQDDWVITAVPRLVARLPRPGRWRDSVIDLPEGAPQQWKNILTDETISAPLAAARVFGRVPLAVLSPMAL